MQQIFQAFVATSSTSNSGTANLTASNSGGTIDVGNSTTGAYNLTGLAGSDTLKVMVIMILLMVVWK